MTTPATGHLVECSQCHKTEVVMDGQNVHDALDCPCCPSSTHTHADENGATPEGTSCRSVIVHANAVVVMADFGGGQALCQ